MSRRLRLGGRSLRQWGLLALSVVIVALSVSEALGAEGSLRHALLWKAGGGASTDAGPAELAGNPDASSIFSSARRKRPVLVTNLARRAIISMRKLAPDRATARCLRVSYRGPRRARVHLFATPGTAALSRYVMLTVTRGRMPATKNGVCKRFVPDAKNHVGAGRGVLFSGRLNTFPKTLKVAARRRGPQAWRNKESHAYRFVVTLVSTNAAQGLAANFNLVWQARP